MATSHVPKDTPHPFALNIDKVDLFGPLRAQTEKWIRMRTRMLTPPCSILMRLDNEARARYHAQRRPSFLDLPGEVQNIIYRYALIVDEPINGILTKVPNVRLLYLCRKIHQDASSILYGENKFTFGIESDWTNREMLEIYGAPTNLAMWPAPTYLAFLHKLVILFSFSPGAFQDLRAPISQQLNIKSMREAFDCVWERLDITYDFRQGSFEGLSSFTLAWLKFRFFKPISHPNCTVKIIDSVPTWMQWCLRLVLQDRNLFDGLWPEQTHALDIADEIIAEAYDFCDIFDRLRHRLFQGILIPQDQLWFYRRMAPGDMLDLRLVFPMINEQFSIRKACKIMRLDNKMRFAAALQLPGVSDVLSFGWENQVYYFAIMIAVRMMDRRTGRRIDSTTCTYGQT